MKTVLSIAAMAMLCSCFAARETQVEMTSAQLIKIDTVYRYDHQQQMLTWKSAGNMYYTSFAALGPTFVLGSRVTVFVQK